MDLVLTQVGLDAVATRWAGESLPSLVTRVNLGAGQWTPTRLDSALQSPLGLSLEVVGKQTDDNVLTVNLQDIDPESAYDCYEIAVMIYDGNQEVALALASSVGTPLFSKVQGGQLGLSFSLGAEAGLDLEALAVETDGFQWTPATPTVRGVDYAMSRASGQSSLLPGGPPRVCEIFVKDGILTEMGTIDLRSPSPQEFRLGCQIECPYITEGGTITITPADQNSNTSSPPRAWAFGGWYVRFAPAGLERFHYKIVTRVAEGTLAQDLIDSMTDAERLPSGITMAGAYTAPIDTWREIHDTPTFSGGGTKVDVMDRDIFINRTTGEVREQWTWESVTTTGGLNPRLAPSFPVHGGVVDVSLAMMISAIGEYPTTTPAWVLYPNTNTIELQPNENGLRGIFTLRYYTTDINESPLDPWRNM